MSKALSLLFLLLLSPIVRAQQTTGMFQFLPGTDDGYVLWGGMFGHDQYLMNNCGEVVHTWVGDGVTLGNSMYLLEDGTLLRCAKADTATHSPINEGGGGERIQLVDWDGTVTWDFIYYDDEKRLHHDIAPMPNGNVLAIAWVRKDLATSIQAGRDPNNLPQGQLFDERIIEIQPTGPTTGTIVWEWNLWDHLVQDLDASKDNFGVVGDHPELLDINWSNPAIATPGQADWVHLNSVDYNAELDQIVLSSQIMSEIWIIDHSTTTEEAAGHVGGTYGKGGDFLYRYGNPQVYDRGTADDQALWRQHDAGWIPAGFPDEHGIMIFNNGLDRPMSFSEIDVIDPPQSTPGVYEVLEAGEAYGPAAKTWNYQAADPLSFYSFFISGAQRTRTGNTVICEGQKGRIFEVSYEGELLWEYVSPVTHLGVLNSTDPIPPAGGGAFQGNVVFRAEKYPVDFPGFDGHDLTTGIQLEADPFNNCLVGLEDLSMGQEARLYPNPAYGSVVINGMAGGTMRVFDPVGKLITGGVLTSDQVHFDLSALPAGVYVMQVDLEGRIWSGKLVVD